MESVEVPPKYKYAGSTPPPRWAAFLRERWMLVATITITAIIVLSIGTIAWVLAQPTRSNSESSGNDRPTPTPTRRPTPTPSSTPTTTPTPTPSSTPTPTPSISVAPTVSANITPFTDEDCTGAKQVYVSNPNGTPVSNTPPGSWHTVMTYDYGQKITVYCELDSSNEFAPEYALINDAYIATSDLSTTKP